MNSAINTADLLSIFGLAGAASIGSLQWHTASIMDGETVEQKISKLKAGGLFADIICIICFHFYLLMNK